MIAVVAVGIKNTCESADDMVRPKLHFFKQSWLLQLQNYTYSFQLRMREWTGMELKCRSRSWTFGECAIAVGILSRISTGSVRGGGWL